VLVVWSSVLGTDGSSKMRILHGIHSVPKLGHAPVSSRYLGSEGFRFSARSCHSSRHARGRQIGHFDRQSGPEHTARTNSGVVKCMMHGLLLSRQGPQGLERTQDMHSRHHARIPEGFDTTQTVAPRPLPFPTDLGPYAHSGRAPPRVTGRCVE